MFLLYISASLIFINALTRPKENESLYDATEKLWLSNHVLGWFLCTSECHCLLSAPWWYLVQQSSSLSFPITTGTVSLKCHRDCAVCHILFWLCPIQIQSQMKILALLMSQCTILVLPAWWILLPFFPASKIFFLEPIPKILESVPKVSFLEPLWFISQIPHSSCSPGNFLGYSTENHTTQKLLVQQTCDSFLDPVFKIESPMIQIPPQSWPHQILAHPIPNIL